MRKTRFSRQLAELAPLLHAGTVRVAIDSTYPLAEARKAHSQSPLTDWMKH